MSKCPRCGTPLIIAEPGKLSRWQSVIPHLGQRLGNTLTTGALVVGTSVLLANVGRWGSVGLVLLLGFTATTIHWCIVPIIQWIEQRTGHDPNGDSQAGEPANTIVIRHGLQKPTPKTWRDLSADQQIKDVCAFAELLARLQHARRPKGQKALRGQVLPSKWVMDDALYKELCDILVKAGLALKVRGRYKILLRGSVREFVAELQGVISVERW